MRLPLKCPWTILVALMKAVVSYREQPFYGTHNKFSFHFLRNWVQNHVHVCLMRRDGCFPLSLFIKFCARMQKRLLSSTWSGTSHGKYNLHAVSAYAQWNLTGALDSVIIKERVTRIHWKHLCQQEWQIPCLEFVLHLLVRNYSLAFYQ